MLVIFVGHIAQLQRLNIDITEHPLIQYNKMHRKHTHVCQIFWHNHIQLRLMHISILFASWLPRNLLF